MINRPEQQSRPPEPPAGQDPGAGDGGRGNGQANGGGYAGLKRDIGSVLTIKGRPIELDPVVQDALDDIRRSLSAEAKQAQATIEENGWTEQVQKVTDRLNHTSLPETERMLLSAENVYPGLLVEALKRAGGPPKEGHSGVKPDDTAGVANTVLRGLAAVKQRFHEQVVDAIFDKNSIDVKTNDRPRYDRVLAQLDKDRLALYPGRTEEQVISANRAAADLGNLGEAIDHFQTTKEVFGAGRITDSTRSAMIGYLRGVLGPKIDPAKLRKGQYDEFIALAYDRVGQPITDGRNDPITLTRAGAPVIPWGFEVDAFDRTDQQQVDKKNILAAGALDYVYNLGERLGVFKLTDTLVLRWAAGQVDIENQDTQNQLYKYWKLRDDRVSPEERGMLYKRVLDKGDTKVLSRMVVNDSFSGLWHKLMSATADYIKDSQDAFRDTAVSRSPIFLATEELQYNLTDHMTGMTHMQVTEMYMQLRDAFALLGSPEIVAQLSAGRRKNVWSVIERLSAEEFSVVPETGSIRTMAVDGNKVFQWISNFDRRAVIDGEFDTFKEAAEAWIIAAASGGADLLAPEPNKEDKQADPESEVDKIDKQGDAW